MSHTIYVSLIILLPLSALFGLQFMLPMEKSVTFTGACANEIILNGLLARLLTKWKKAVMLELSIKYVGIKKKVVGSNPTRAGCTQYYIM